MTTTDNPQNIQTGDQVKLAISEEPDPVTAPVVRVYRDAIGSLVADVKIRPGDVRTQNVEFLTRVDPAYAQTITRLAREWRAAETSAPDGRIPKPAFAATFKQLHEAAGRAGISEDEAHTDLYDEIHALSETDVAAA